jgi:hypothetical protein
MSTSIRVPFRLDGGRVQTTNDYSTQVEQKIVNVMTTSTLDRVGLPEYGGNASSLIFEKLDTLEFVDYKVDLVAEVSRNVSGVTVVDIIVSNEDIHTNVTVIYTLPLTPNRRFTFRIAASGQITEETPL